jgi:Ca-activated chloride channel family protein
MKGRRINMIADNIIKLTNQLNGEDLLSIITFNDKAEIFLTPTPLEQIKHIYEKISTIKCSGGTEIFQGLKAGADILWGSRSHEGYSQLILFTDGQTYGDESACYELADKIHAKGIKINTVGIGHEWNDVFLDRLAGVTGGNTTYVSSANDMSSFIKDLTNSLSFKVAGNINLDFHLRHEIELKFLFRLQPEVTELILEKPIALGDLYQQKSSLFLAAFVIPPIHEKESELTLAKGKISFEVYDPEKRKQSQSFSIKIRTGNVSEREIPPKEMVEALSRISIYQMQEKANAEVRAGQIDQAVKRLGSISTQLFKLGIGDVAQKAIEEAQSLKNNKKYSLEGDKQLKYGTRALIAPNFEKSMT